MVMAEIETVDTLPQWLYKRFGSRRFRWDELDEADTSYWEHEAAAVRRAVARNGFRGHVMHNAHELYPCALCPTRMAIPGEVLGTVCDATLASQIPDHVWQ